ncbi:hypothetical protein BD779DRAFT_1608730 [Infundibulicybe gibba]|nr:hypothetical protein BD779DRAFT_1608730 [Infundibulicybe gibba]
MAKPRQVSRSQTLPRAFKRSQRKQLLEIAGTVGDSIVLSIRRWIQGIAIVEFDLDNGPTICGIYPPTVLAPIEEENIAFSAFPDSLQFEQGSQIHSFRIREHLTSTDNQKRSQSVDGYIYGFSHFTQRRDPSSRRGYQQQSVVVLTQHPYPALFYSIISTFGPLFQKHGIPMAEAAGHNIATWRDPTPGETIELGFLGSVFLIELPHTVDQQQLTETSSFKEKYDPRVHILASAPPLLPPPILLFGASFSHLWSIWECLVLCEPILVFGSSPAQTSQAIWWLRDLLRPIPMAGDVRPYFTVQDGDHSQLVNRLPPKSGILLGVTNPFFEKSCIHWPHVLSLGQRNPHVGNKRHSITHPAGPEPGWKTKTHNRYVSKDKTLLKELESAHAGNERLQMEISLSLRRHFCARTTALLTPLSRYLNTLIPSPIEVAAARTSHHTLRLKPFNSVNFFASLKLHGSPLPFRSANRRKEFYERWLKTPTFGMWLGQQEHIVQGVLEQASAAG